MKKSLSPDQDRKQMLNLADILGASKVLRDDCNDCFIPGKGESSIYSYGLNTFAVGLCCKTKVKYKRGKEQFRFMRLSQDGDTEGVFLLEKRPNKEQAALILKLLGIRKKRTLTDEQREELKKRGEKLAAKLHKHRPAFR